MTTTALASAGQKLGWTISDTLVMAWRNLLRYIRLPQLLVVSTIQPVMFVLLFAYVLGGAIDVGDVDYIDFLLPGILVQTTMFGSTQTGVGLADDLSKGMIDRFRSLPMARSAVLGGRILADTVRNTFRSATHGWGRQYHRFQVPRGSISGDCRPKSGSTFWNDLFLDLSTPWNFGQGGRDGPGRRLYLDLSSCLYKFGFCPGGKHAWLAGGLCRG